MLKPAAIRDVIARCVPQLAQNPEGLILTVGDGRIVATGARSPLVQWQYPLSIGVIDLPATRISWSCRCWPGCANTSQSCSPTRRSVRMPSGRVGAAGRDLYDLLITVQLTGGLSSPKRKGIGWEHVPEPPEDPYDGITQLFINGEHQPWPPTPTPATRPASRRPAGPALPPANGASWPPTQPAPCRAAQSERIAPTTAGWLRHDPAQATAQAARPQRRHRRRMFTKLGQAGMAQATATASRPRPWHSPAAPTGSPRFTTSACATKSGAKPCNTRNAS